jgi:N-acetylglucosamine transport system substrate-binding protein
MNKKLRFLIFLGLLIGFLFGGCSNKEKIAQNVVPGDGIGGILEIQYFVGGYGDAWWKDAIAGFKEKYPNINVVEQAGSKINETMKPRWISDNPPDVVYIDGAGSSETQMVNDEQLMDLTDFLPTLKLEDGTLLKDVFIVPPSDFNGKVYTLPLLFDTRGTWYDMAWFEKEGFQVPVDYDSWMVSMRSIKTKAGIPPMATTGVYPAVFLKGILYPAFAAEGGLKLLVDLIDGKGGVWSNQATLNVMKRIEVMREEGFVDPSFAALTHTEAQMNFLMHKNAFVPTGFWLPREMAGSIPSDFVFGIIPTPMNKRGEKMAVIPDVHPVAIAKKAKNPKAAKAFVEYIFTRKSAIKFAEMTGAMMNITGIDFQNNPNVAEYLKRASALITDTARVEMYPLPHAMATDLEKPVGDAVISLLLGDLTAEEFCVVAEKAATLYRANR